MRCVRFSAVLVLCACYRYVPEPSATLASGNEVRLVLTSAGATALVPILGRETISVDGRVVSTSDSGYVVAVSGTTKRVQGMDGAVSSSRTTWAGESVMMPRAAVAGVERRSLDTRRTALTGTVVAVAAVAAIRLIVHAIGSSGGGDDGGTVITP